MLTFVIATGFVIIALLAYDITRWYSPGQVITRKQKIARILSAGVALAILLFMILGSHATESKRLTTALGYWMLCLGLAFALMFLALFDIREVGLGYGQERKRMLRDLISPRLRRKKTGDDSGNGRRKPSRN